jgi:RND family efflux transporter MFP subunit
MQISRYSIKISLFLVVLALSGCNSNDIKDPRLEKKLVDIMTVAKATMPEQSFTGIVRARVQSNLGFRISGKIVKRFVHEGEKVTAGQPLMQIDDNDIALLVSAQKDAVAAANARFELAAFNEKRYKTLLLRHTTSKQTYKRFQTAADTAYAELLAAKAQLQIVKNKKGYSLLVADANGTVLRTLGEVGQVVSAGQAVIILAHNGAREVSVDLPETLRPKVGSSAQAVLFGSNVRNALHLRWLSDAANPLTRTFEARYVFKNNMTQIPLGSTVTVYLPLEKGVSTVKVPLGAVTDEGDGSGIWVYNAQTSSISFHHVKIISLTTEDAILRSGVGVAPGDKIVAVGAHFLHEGQKVRVTHMKVLQ